MATSFSVQIETIIYLMQSLKPKNVLDIGKGFGKYGFLLHEYYGIDPSYRPDPLKTLKCQSRVVIDAVESNPDYLWPHLDQVYGKVYEGRIEALYGSLEGYDLVLMLDVIEHLEKADGVKIVRHFVSSGANMIVSTPATFFQQALYGSDDERHVSFWSPEDVANIGFPFDYRRIGPARVFLISPSRLDIRGFGQSPIKRLRRLARAVSNELRP